MNYVEETKKSIKNNTKLINEVKNSKLLSDKYINEIFSIKNFRS